jgi:hypothetical protein
MLRGIRVLLGCFLLLAGIDAVASYVVFTAPASKNGAPPTPATTTLVPTAHPYVNGGGWSLRNLEQLVKQTLGSASPCLSGQIGKGNFTRVDISPATSSGCPKRHTPYHYLFGANGKPSFITINDSRVFYDIHPTGAVPVTINGQPVLCGDNSSRVLVRTGGSIWPGLSCSEPLTCQLNQSVVSLCTPDPVPVHGCGTECYADASSSGWMFWNLDNLLRSVSTSATWCVSIENRKPARKAPVNIHRVSGACPSSAEGRHIMVFRASTKKPVLRLGAAPKHGDALKAPPGKRKLLVDGHRVLCPGAGHTDLLVGAKAATHGYLALNCPA